MFKHLALAVLSFALVARGQVVDAPQPFGSAQTSTFPYSMTGRLVFAQGSNWFQGSGTVLRSNAILTAAHTLWDADAGFSTDLLFQRALDGEHSAGDQFASRVYILGGYRDAARRYGANDIRAFSQDLGAVLFAAPLAGGAHAGWWASPAVLAGSTPLLALGYGAQTHDGSHLLAAETTNGFFAVTPSFFASHSLAFEEGMSGGPVFARDAAGNLFVTAVVVAGSTDANLGGIRILDEAAAAFIRRYLP